MGATIVDLYARERNMMSFLLIAIVSLCVATLTFFSGFGLGTLLMPAFALFFPIKVAIAATAIVHLANNLFKLILVGKHADMKTVLAFALPAAAAAFLGAALLTVLPQNSTLFSYSIGSVQFATTAVELVIGSLIVAFAFFELLPAFSHVQFQRKFIPLGGILSGFFGGLSGMQGALRSAFLAKSGLCRDAFIGTTVVSAVVVDVARLLVYGVAFYTTLFEQLTSEQTHLIWIATITAFAGSFIGKKLLKKVTYTVVQRIVGIMLLVLGIAISSGIV